MMTMFVSTNIFLLFILVPTLYATHCESNSKNTHAMGVSEQRKSPNTGKICTNSNLDNPSENTPSTSISESMRAATLKSNELDDLINTKISDKFEAILKFESILIEEKSKLFSSSSKEECDYNCERILQGATRTARSCSEDISLVIAAAKMRVQWALEMIGANGEPGYNTIHDKVRSVGDFDQCMDLDTRQDFEGRYCTTDILISRIQQKNFSPPVPFTLGLCFPSSCDGAAVEDFINEYFQSRDDILASAEETKCQERHMKLSTQAKISIVFFSIYATLLVVATIYDAFYKRLWLEKKIKKNDGHNMDNNVLKSEADSASKTSHSVLEPIMGSKNQKTKSYSQDESGTLQKSNKSELLDQVLMTFSMYTNTAKLFSNGEEKESMRCIHGLRFICIFQLVLVHLVVWEGNTRDNTRVYLDGMYKKWPYMIVFKGDTGVDTFFTMGGTFTAFALIREFSHKAMTPKSFAKFVFHRLWRVLPVTMLLMASYVPLGMYTGSGPFWPQEGFEKDECKDSWMYTALLINNFLELGEWCMGWTWYLSCDMQFYIVSPLILLPLVYYGWKGFLSPMAFLLTSMICSGVITSVYDVVAVRDYEFLVTGEKDDGFLSIYYLKPYTRIGPYIIGLVTGFLLVKTEMKARLPKLVVILGWTAATASMLAVTFVPYDHVRPDRRHSNLVRALHNAISRNVWSLSISWVIFACANGYGGIVNTLLAWKALIPIGRMSFCTYMVHTIVMQQFLYTRSSLFRMSDVQLIPLFVSSFVLSYMGGYVAYIAFEVPMAGLEKIAKAQAKKRE